MSQNPVEVLERLMDNYSKVDVMTTSLRIMLFLAWFAPKSVYAMESIGAMLLTIQYAAALYQDMNTQKSLERQIRDAVWVLAHAMLSMAYMQHAIRNGCAADI